MPKTTEQWAEGDPIPKDIGASQRLILRLHTQDPSASVEQLASRAGRSVPVVRNIIRRLHDLHGITIIVPGGPTFNG